MEDIDFIWCVIIEGASTVYREAWKYAGYSYFLPSRTFQKKQELIPYDNSRNSANRRIKYLTQGMSHFIGYHGIFAESNHKVHYGNVKDAVDKNYVHFWDENGAAVTDL